MIDRFWIRLLATILFAQLPVIVEAKGGRTVMPDKLTQSYTWGTKCAKGLSIGLMLPGRVFKREVSSWWRWALRNHTDQPREVTIYHARDISYRYWLQVFKENEAQPILEFPPQHRNEPLELLTTPYMFIPETATIEKDSLAELEPETLSFGAGLKPGTYRLRVHFGGTDFDFECHSGFVEIEVR